MAIFGWIIFVLIGLGFLAVGLVTVAVSNAFSGKVEFAGMVWLGIAGFIFYNAYRFCPFTILIN